jgi:WD40 repeat protein
MKEKIYQTYFINPRALAVDAVGVAPSSITSAAWSPENTIYVGTDAGALLVVRPATGEVVPAPAAVASTARAALEAEAAFDEEAGLPAGCAAAWALTGGGAIRAVAFTKTHVVLAGADGALRFYTPAAEGPTGAVYPAATHACTVALTDGEFEEVLGVSFSPQFNQAVVTTADCGVYIMDIVGAFPPRPPADAQPTDSVGDIPMSPAALSSPRPSTNGMGSPRLSVHASNVEFVKIGDFHTGAVTGVAPLPDGVSLATCGLDGTLRGWDLRSGLLAWKRTLSSPQTSLATGSLAAGCCVIAVSSDTGVIRVFDVSAGAGAPPNLTLRARLMTAAPDAMALCPCGAVLALAGADCKLWFIEMATPAVARVVGFVMLPARAMSMSFSSDALLLVSAEGGEVCSVTPPPPGYQGNGANLDINPRDVHVRTLMAGGGTPPILTSS